MNEDPSSNVNKEEVKDVVFAIRASSACGADGFTCFFFQKIKNTGDHWRSSHSRGSKFFFFFCVCDCSRYMNGTTLIYACCQRRKIHNTWLILDQSSCVLCCTRLSPKS